MKKRFKRFLALLLTTAMVLNIGPVSTIVNALVEGVKAIAAEESIVVIAGSDFQHDSGNDAGAKTVKGILDQVEEDYSSIDGFLFAGDYSNSYDYNSSVSGKNALTAAVESVYGTGWDSVYIQGNHDEDNLVSDGVFSSSGKNDTDDYGVFVIHEQDYMWHNDDEARIKNTASNLDAYLDAKVAEGYTKPIFVISHLPLHYTMRNPVEASNSKGDGTFANYIFDVLNEGGADGLDIIFLYGHNHAHGWDNYIGGEAVYLAVGDKINIAQKSTTVYKEETLNFTYMNAGFTGYYTDECGHNIDDVNYLTMSVFEITDSQVLIKRYNQSGEYNLKSVGRQNTHVQSTHGKTETMTVNIDTYASGQTIALTVPVPDATVKDETTNITVTAPGITGVNVTVKTPTYDTEKYSAYASYDITPVDYTQGNTATVTIPAPEGFDASKPAVVLYAGAVIATDTNISDGITFTTNHFSTYDVAQVDESAGVTASGNLVSTTTVSDNAVSSVESGSYYLIQHAHDTSHRTLTNTTANNSKALSISGTVDASNTNLWYITSATGGYYIQFGGPNGQYLTIGDGTAELTNTATVIAIGDQHDDEWSFGRKLGRTTYYLNQIGGRNSDNNYAAGWTGGGTDYGDHWNLYKVENGNGDPVTLTVTPGSKTIITGTTANLIASVLVDGASANSCTITWTSSNTAAATVDSNGEVTGVADGEATITATLTYANNQKVNGTVAVEIPVTVTTKTVESITVDPMEGSVERGSGLTAPTGSTMTVTYDDGTSETIDVTVGMLDGTYNLKKNGTYTGLSITYAGKSVEDYTLKVVDVVGNDFPSYPEQGSVDVNKTATGQDFQNTGVARVELSTSGLPVKHGVDVIIMLDTSSSMQYGLTTSAGASEPNRRIDALETALENLLKLLQTKDAEDNYQDIDIAIADFNGNRGHIIDEDDYFSGVDQKINDNNGNVYTNGNNVQCDAEDFKDIGAINITNITNQLDTSSGTNYDWAFETIYKLGAAKQAANGDEERELIVIFMSDGAPFQWNHFSGNGNQPGAVNGVYSDDTWEHWITGEMTDADWNKYQGGNPGNRHFYNEDGLNWMAEAVKGTGDKYPVIYNGTDLGTDASKDYGNYFRYVPGLGATVYAIGLSLYPDGNVGTEAINTVMSAVASTDADGNPLYTTAYSAEDLNGQFADIGHKIIFAAQNAVFEDQMGTAFDLQMNPNIVDSSDNSRTDISTDITVTEKPVYTAADLEDGKCTVDQVGKAYDNGTVLETVKFTSNIAATSTALPNEANIIKNGVICAKYFWYNTNSFAVQIDTDGDGTAETTLAPETFYWKIGTINEKQFTLSYAVYLTGSMDGNALPNDSYETNNYAKLSYTNWLGNDVSQSVPSPVMPWGGANVSYAFYLVNSAGQPVDANGNVVANVNVAYKVTQPVLYQSMNLNSDAVVLSTVAGNVLPDGYTLYDTAAKYEVTVKSGEGNSSWAITGNYPASTYVTGYAGAQDYSNEETSGTNESYDYTHTTVYFAVVWTIGTVPDTVVIDFGLPVDISVLVNDMFGGKGTLAGVGFAANMPNVHTTNLDSSFADSVNGDYGTAKVNDREVTYTLNTSNGMQMKTAEELAYAVEYTGSVNSGYYYGTVTVIPATTVYYEDSFLTLEGFSTAWTEGTAPTTTQGEDRPGKYSLGTIDANNVYGYDSAYTNMSTYSMGSVASVHVDANSYATAKFTFYGTGFDVISLTSNQTGVLCVRVYAAEPIGSYALGDRVKSVVVDTYYGYSQNEEGKWEISENDPDALYQVPVMQIENLTYGKYNVEITATYVSAMDHTSADGYDLYLDAIRIYDPAGTTYGEKTEDSDSSVIDKVIQDAYIADGEGWPVYEELRNNVISAEGVTITPDADDDVTVTFPTDDTFVKGAIFIDSADQNNSIQNYVSYGPNNELYLAKGQAIAFNVSTNAYVADVQLGIKVANGGSVTYAINGVEKTVSTTTDMYYSILSYAKAGAVVIQNVSESNCILSLTNIKVTYTQDPASIPFTTSLLWMDGPSAGRALMSLRAPAVEDEVPEVTEPEPTEPEVTEPETTEPEVTEPEATEPEVTEPETTEPEVTEPETMEPEVTEPEETEPEEPTKDATTVINSIVTALTKAVNMLLSWLKR